MKTHDTIPKLHHPKGLSVLFFTEFWERFSFYGMRALLILFMVDALEKGGFGFDTEKAAHIYGWYTALVYATAIPGGWLADKFLGLQRSVFMGGALITIGHFCLAMGSPFFFFLGLAFVVTGTGSLKPNVSALVGRLYTEGDARRDAGFSIFYMGINLGATISPIICGWLGQKFNWHYGFGAAGVGMLCGLIQYHVGRKHLASEVQQSLPLILKPVLITLATMLGLTWAVLYEASQGKNIIGNIFSVSLALGTIYWFFTNLKSCQPNERKGLWAIAILFVFSALFWGAFEQAGSSLNLFAQRFTENTIMGWNFPSSWFQSVNAVFIVALSPIFAWIWLSLGKREPSSPAKFANGLWFVGLGFLVMSFAAMSSHNGATKVGPMWLVVCYLCHTIGELCLSPVGLSTVTKLAPQRMVGAMMGVWFLSISLGNKMGGSVAGYFEKFPLSQLFGAVFLTTTACAVILVCLIKPIKKLMGDVR